LFLLDTHETGTILDFFTKSTIAFAVSRDNDCEGAHFGGSTKDSIPLFFSCSIALFHVRCETLCSKVWWPWVLAYSDISIYFFAWSHITGQVRDRIGTTLLQFNRPRKSEKKKIKYMFGSFLSIAFDSFLDPLILFIWPETV
jgi:hypothetical protein